MPRVSPPRARAPVPQPQVQPEPMEGSEEGGEPEPGMAGPMGAIDMAQIRQRLMQDPNYLQQLMQEIQATNPQLYQALQQNPQALIQLLMGGAGRGGGGYGRPRHGGIQVTAEEKAAIDRVCPYVKGNSLKILVLLKCKPHKLSLLAKKTK